MTATVLKTITEPVPVTLHGRATRPTRPDNFDRLEYADQVAHHIAVLRWEEAHPEIVQAKRRAEQAADKIARRAKAEASIANDARLIALWKTDGSSAARIADLEESMAEDQAALDRENAQEKADARWLADLGDSEPVNPDPEMPRHNCPDGISNPVWWDAIAAWEKAHPEIVAQRKAEERAAYEAEQEPERKKLDEWKAANPKKIAAIIKAVGIDKLTKPIEVEHVTVAAIMRMIDDTDADELETTGVKEYADDVFDQIMSEPRRVANNEKRLKRELKNPAAALERARDEAQREEMDGSGEKDEAKADARQNGESWSDIKDEWEEQWLEDNWTPEAEAEFVVSFENQWLKDHGTPFPELVEAA
jgi:hypothetical protein